MSLRQPQRTARRRAEILATARELFDAEGVAAVTTGRIAQVAGISPGNLYYWFPNKTEILRALFDEWASALVVPVRADDDPAEILRFLHARATGPDPGRPYGFFARDLVTLLHDDPELARRYRANLEARLDALVALAQRVVDAGLAVPPAPPTSLADVVALVWLVSETAPPFAQVVGLPRFDPARVGLAAVSSLLSAAGREALGLEVRA